MDLGSFERSDRYTWTIVPREHMFVPIIAYGDEALMRAIDSDVLEQAQEVAALPGIVGALYLMPGVRRALGLPDGCVAAFDEWLGGVALLDGAGQDVSCGIRILSTGISANEVCTRQQELKRRLFDCVPFGPLRPAVGVSDASFDRILRAGARWAVDHGFGIAADLLRTEDIGCQSNARPEHVSYQARRLSGNAIGSLGQSPQHSLRVQNVDEVFEPSIADAFGIHVGDALVTIHCGAGGLGQQIELDYLRDMKRAATAHSQPFVDDKRVFAPIASQLGRQYLGAIQAAANCALANRQVLTHVVREALMGVFGNTEPTVVCDVSHATCKEEHHVVDGRRRRLFVYRKGAGRAARRGYPFCLEGSFGDSSYILMGSADSAGSAFGSACHGFRQLSPFELSRTVETLQGAGLAQVVAKLTPIITLTGATPSH